MVRSALLLLNSCRPITTATEDAVVHANWDDEHVLLNQCHTLVGIGKLQNLCIFLFLLTILASIGRLSAVFGVDDVLTEPTPCIRIYLTNLARQKMSNLAKVPVVMPTPASTSIQANSMNVVTSSARKRLPQNRLNRGMRKVLVTAKFEPMREMRR